MEIFSGFFIFTMSMKKTYSHTAAAELQAWQHKMLRRPRLTNQISAAVQVRINKIIPEKVHKAITTGIEAFAKTIIAGSDYIAPPILRTVSLRVREDKVRKRIETYRLTASVEGAVTGAGGILLGLADFPILMGIKMKLLFDVAALYGFDTTKLSERIFILHIFELAFSTDAHRKETYERLANWHLEEASLPSEIKEYDWRTFQQQYRDYLDIAKLAQLLPVIGAPVGFFTNRNLLKKLGDTAMSAYRMRLIEEKYFEKFV